MLLRVRWVVPASRALRCAGLPFAAAPIGCTSSSHTVFSYRHAATTARNEETRIASTATTTNSKNKKKRNSKKKAPPASAGTTSAGGTVEGSRAEKDVSGSGGGDADDDMLLQSFLQSDEATTGIKTTVSKEGSSCGDSAAATEAATKGANIHTGSSRAEEPTPTVRGSPSSSPSASVPATSKKAAMVLTSAANSAFPPADAAADVRLHRAFRYYHALPLRTGRYDPPPPHPPAAANPTTAAATAASLVGNDHDDEGLADGGHPPRPGSATTSACKNSNSNSSHSVEHRRHPELFFSFAEPGDDPCSDPSACENDDKVHMLGGNSSCGGGGGLLERFAPETHRAARALYFGDWGCGHCGHANIRAAPICDRCHINKHIPPTTTTTVTAAKKQPSAAPTSPPGPASMTAVANATGLLQRFPVTYISIVGWRSQRRLGQRQQQLARLLASEGVNSNGDPSREGPISAPDEAAAGAIGALSPPLRLALHVVEPGFWCSSCHFLSRPQLRVPTSIRIALQSGQLSLADPRVQGTLRAFKPACEHCLTVHVTKVGDRRHPRHFTPDPRSSWECSCGAANFSGHLHCGCCGGEKMASYRRVPMASARLGDWLCARCATSNMSSAETCRACTVRLGEQQGGRSPLRQHAALIVGEDLLSDADTRRLAPLYEDSLRKALTDHVAASVAALWSCGSCHRPVRLHERTSGSCCPHCGAHMFPAVYPQQEPSATIAAASASGGASGGGKGGTALVPPHMLRFLRLQHCANCHTQNSRLREACRRCGVPFGNWRCGAMVGAGVPSTDGAAAGTASTPSYTTSGQGSLLGFSRVEKGANQNKSKVDEEQQQQQHQPHSQQEPPQRVCGADNDGASAYCKACGTMRDASQQPFVHMPAWEERGLGRARHHHHAAQSWTRW